MSRTNAKRGKAQLAALKRTYDGRFDDVSAAVFVVVPPEGRIVSVNVEAEELTGYERAELEAMELPDIFRAEDRSRIASIFQAAPAEFRKLFEHNVIVRKRSKRKIVVDMGFRRSREPGEEAFVFTLQDITDLKENEERVIRAHEYVNSIIDSIVEVLLVVSDTGLIETVNAAALRLLGWRDNELAGRKITDVLAETDVAKLLASPEVAEVETHLLARDGRRVPVLVSKSSLKVRRSGAASQRAVIVAMDITERKRIERLVAEQQMMIVQASKMSSLGEMASSIAHEINNPLQVILGRCELLEMQAAAKNTDEALASVALIDRMSQRIFKIIRGLQALARDQRHDAMERADLREILKETLALCEQRIKVRVDRFEVPELPEAIPLTCRPTQVSQVILNLLNNSYDEVSGKPGAWIRIEVERADGMVSVAVADSGPGLPPEVAEKMFTPFFTTKPVGKGTGIGLSVSKSLVEAHGGTLELDRASPHTRFVLRLPQAGAEGARKAG